MENTVLTKKQLHELTEAVYGYVEGSRIFGDRVPRDVQVELHAIRCKVQLDRTLTTHELKIMAFTVNLPYTRPDNGNRRRNLEHAYIKLGVENRDENCSHLRREFYELVRKDEDQAQFEAVLKRILDELELRGFDLEDFGGQSFDEVIHKNLNWFKQQTR